MFEKKCSKKIVRINQNKTKRILQNTKALITAEMLFDIFLM